MKFKLSSTVNALYIYANEGEFSETLEVGPDVYMDIDKDGRILGIEFLDPEYLIQFIRERGGELDLNAPVAREQSVERP
jgi:uncharacterized protein YuzE